MSEHSPLPWSIVKDDGDYPDGILDADNKRVTSVDGWPERDRPNIALIVKSVNGYAALRAKVRELRDHLAALDAEDLEGKLRWSWDLCNRLFSELFAMVKESDT